MLENFMQAQNQQLNKVIRLLNFKVDSMATQIDFSFRTTDILINHVT